MKIAFATTWEERCGLAEYAANLVKHSKHEYRIIHRPFTSAVLSRDARDCDVVVLNHEPGVYPPNTQASDLRAIGKPVVVILHASHSGSNISTYQFTDGANRVVVHEDCNDVKVFPAKWRLIPMGVPVVDVSDVHTKYDIGSIGFPFPWKGFYEIATTAKRLGRSCMFITPESHHVSAKEMATHIKRANPDANVITEWMNQEDAARTLAQCRVVVFAYHGGNLGISGAARIGIAAERPMVVVKSCRQFNDLFGHVEIYTASDPYHLDEAIEEALVKHVAPIALKINWSWEIIARRFDLLFEELLCK